MRFIFNVLFWDIYYIGNVYIMSLKESQNTILFCQIIVGWDQIFGNWPVLDGLTLFQSCGNMSMLCLKLILPLG